MSVRIVATGVYIPEQGCDKPDHVNAFSGVDDSFNEIFAGKGRRYICNNEETPTFMGIQAARQALENADIDPRSIDAILCYTLVPDNDAPKDVYKIAGEIGCDGALCWTIDTACASFLSHLHCASNLQRAGMKRILIINSMNWVGRAFAEHEGQFAGDGAGAVIVEACPEGQGVIACKEISSPAQFDFVTLKSAQLSGQREALEFSRNNRVIHRSINILPELAGQLLADNRVALDEVDWTLCHQPGMPAIEKWHAKLGVSVSRNLNTYSFYGNMSAANIPISLHHHYTREQVVDEGDLALFFTAGAGIHVAAALYRF